MKMHSALNADSYAKNHDWKVCAKWINACGCLPPALQARFMSDEMTLGQFANALRDGEILCNLINFLQPDTIDSAQINKRAQMSQILCLNNIRLFLDACKQPPFSLKEKDLFDPQMLYDLDLPRVIRALGVLSRSPAVADKGVQGFELISQQNPDEFHNSIDDIYYNIPPIEPSDNEGPECYYTDESFLIGGHASNDSHDGVYQMIVQQPQNSSEAGQRLSSRVQPAKRDFVIREIVNTEDNFIKGLDILMDEFLVPLSKILSESDRKCICMNIDSIVKLHKNLYAELYQACKGGAGRTLRICSVFEKFKEHMMREYAEYFASMDRSLAKCDSLSNGPINLKHHNGGSQHSNIAEFRQKLEECRSKSKISFKLTDLLRLPYQRILKYHLLFNELLKQTDEEHRAKEAIKKTRDSMCEVGNYLNECQRDKEILNQIEKVMSHLSGDFKMPPGTTLKDYGRYIKDDNVRIKSFEAGERMAHTRTVFLFEKAMLICKSKGESYSYKETLLINEFSLEEMSSSASINLVKNSVFDLSGSNHNGSVSSISTSNIAGGGANAHNFLLVNADRSRSYGFYFKNSEQKRIWKQSFMTAKDKIQPPGQCENNHKFMLFNFDRDLVVCHVCKMFLHGIFYQGYKCDLCGSIAHKSCLTKTSLCSASNFQESRVVKALTSSVSSASTQDGAAKFKNHSSSTSLDRQSSNLTRQTPYFVRALYSYDGRPPPPETPVLVFKEGELIQVLDDDDDEWWKGVIYKYRPAHNTNIRIKDEEGYFPRSYVRVSNTAVNMEEYGWFAPVDRTMADLILNRIANPDHQTIFMVRCRQEGGYAISIKYNGLVEHIKINLNYLDPSTHSIVPQQSLASADGLNNSNGNAAKTGAAVAAGANVTAYYSIDQRHFSSVVSLVSFYTLNMLKENFPQLETTLGLPYREALPVPVGCAQARYDFAPTAPNSEQISLLKGARYYIISKEPNGWWRVFNIDGLIGFAPSNFLHELKDNGET